MYWNFVAIDGVIKNQLGKVLCFLWGTNWSFMYWNFVAINGVIKNQLIRNTTVTNCVITNVPTCFTFAFATLETWSVSADFTLVNQRTLYSRKRMRLMLDRQYKWASRLSSGADGRDGLQIRKVNTNMDGAHHLTDTSEKLSVRQQ
jgi:hypothetical protein